MSENIGHTRPIPPEWNGLLELAHDVTQDQPAGTLIKRRPFLRLCRNVLRLPNERLFANFYFGLGEVMTGMSNMLKNPEIKRRLIQDCAEGMLYSALLRRGAMIPSAAPFIPLVLDIKNRGNMDEPFRALAHQAYKALETPERSLADALSFGTTARRSLALTAISGLALPILFGQDRKGYGTTDHIHNNALVGARGVFLRLFLNWDGNGKLTNQQNLTQITPDVLGKVFEPRPYMGAAQLRLDEFNLGKGFKTKNGLQVFDRNYLDTPPPSPTTVAGVPQLHEERLICPAFHAGKLAWQVATIILPGIIQTANTLIPGEVYPELYR